MYEQGRVADKQRVYVENAKGLWTGTEQEDCWGEGGDCSRVDSLIGVGKSLSDCCRNICLSIHHFNVGKGRREKKSGSVRTLDISRMEVKWRERGWIGYPRVCVCVCVQNKKSHRLVRLDMFMSFQIKYEDDCHVQVINSILQQTHTHTHARTHRMKEREREREREREKEREKESEREKERERERGWDTFGASASSFALANLY